MNNIFKKSFYFILPLLVIFTLSQVAWMRIYGSKRSEYLGKFKRLDDEVDVVILGDSHPDRALDPDLLPPNVAKLTFASDSFKEMYLKLDYVLEKGIKLDYLVLPLDYNSFSKYRSNTNNRDKILTISNVGKYNKLYNTDMKIIEKRIREYVPILIPENASNLTQYAYEYIKRKLKKIILNNKDNGSAHNNAWKNLSEKQKLNQAKSRVKGQFKSGSINERMLNTFGEILKTCEENDIKVIGVRYPVTKFYHEHIPKAFIDEVNAYIAKSKLYRVLDYSDLYWEQGEYFTNQDHLNEYGSRAFTNIFVNDLKPIK